MTRRVILWSLIVIASLLVGAPSRAASKIDAETFATSPLYCGTGGFTVPQGGTVTVQGGTGNIPGACSIDLLLRSKIKFIDATINGASTLTIDDGNKSQVLIKDTNMAFVGAIQLAPGCCDGEGTGDRVKITDSVITSSDGSILVHPQPLGTGGKVDIKRSTLDAGGGATDFVKIFASASFGVSTKGKIKVTRSTLDATGADLSVTSWNEGKTVVKDTTLTGATIKISTGPGGKCTSDGNTPPVPCT